jgi:hypothetical protein
MKSLIIIIMVVLVLLVLCFVGYKIGTNDQKYERDTGRDFASHRDRDFGGGMYGGGYGGGYGRPRTRSYDDGPDPYDLNEPVEDSAEDRSEEEYTDFSNDEEPRAPEF